MACEKMHAYLFFKQISSPIALSFMLSYCANAACWQWLTAPVHGRQAVRSVVLPSFEERT